jgi:flagellar motor switch protein FliM
MQNELNQEEIDAMVRAARSGGKAEGGRREPKVELWDVRRAGQIGREQLQAITHLHEAFARNLTTALGSYLRVACSAALVSAEHLTYREFIERIRRPPIWPAVNCVPWGCRGRCNWI